MDAQISLRIKAAGKALGFEAVGIGNIDLGKHKDYLKRWLALGRAAGMHYMSRHGDKRTHPEKLVPGTLRVISVRMNYLNQTTDQATDLLDHTSKAYIARYALGRDYHKLMRKRLQRLADWISTHIKPHQHRVFVDSAPVLEKALAEQSGLGWIGKHTLLLHREAGSWFFIGEIYTDLPLTIDQIQPNHCGDCTRCLDVCPTQAIVAPYELDARRCIAYLTIENKGPIPTELRKPMGNRIFGCDDCQLFCPWNKFAKPTNENDFSPRHRLDSIELLELLSWDEDCFLERTLGSPIRRAGYKGWLRNLSVALGNAAFDQRIVSALHARLTGDHWVTNDPMLTEHFQWAIHQHTNHKADF